MSKPTPIPIRTGPPIATHQRQTSSSCGGGCPSCQAAPLDQTEVEAEAVADEIAHMAEPAAASANSGETPPRFTAEAARAVGVTTPTQSKAEIPLLKQRTGSSVNSAELRKSYEARQAIGSLGNPLQTKLRINQPSDPYEEEADRVAAEIMRMPEVPTGLEGQSPKTAPLVQRRVRDDSAGIGTAPPIVHEVLSSPGRPLDAPTRAFFEPRFGYDFSAVRVHTDERAATSARAVDTQAYTVGNDIVLDSGSLARGGSTELELMAHELTHVVQQSQGHSGTPHHSERVNQDGVTPERISSFAGLGAGDHLSPVVIHQRTNIGTLYRSGSGGGGSAGSPHATNCFTNTSEAPPAGWLALRQAAFGLPDNFYVSRQIEQEQEDVEMTNGISYRNKGATQYLIEFKNGSSLQTDVFDYYSGRAGALQFRQYLEQNLRQFVPRLYLPRHGRPRGVQTHNEASMIRYQLAIDHQNSSKVRSVRGYTFSFYEPCSQYCRDQLQRPPRSYPRYIDSLCVPTGYEWTASQVPVSGPGHVERDNPNCTPAKRLKTEAGDNLGAQGWTRFTVTNEPCADEEEQDRHNHQDEPDQQSPESEGESENVQESPEGQTDPARETVSEPNASLGEALAPVGAAAIALAAVSLGADAIGKISERREAGRERRALERKARNRIEKIMRDSAQKAATSPEAARRAELGRMKQQAARRINAGLAFLAAAGLALAASRSEAQVTFEGSGDDPIAYLLKSLSGRGDPIPEPLLTMIENDPELRRIAEEAARQGGLPAVHQAASAHAAQILSENLDQFTREEVEALMLASSAVGPGVDSLIPTFEQLRAAARNPGTAVGDETGTGAVEGEVPGTQPEVSEGDVTGEGEHKAGMGTPAPRELEGVEGTVQSLWAAVTSTTEGIPIDTGFAEAFKQEFSDGIAEKDLIELLGILLDLEAGMDPETDPYELLQQLRARLDQLESAGEEGKAGEAEVGSDSQIEGDLDSGREPGPEELKPLESSNLNMDSAQEDLKTQFQSMSAADWPPAGATVRHTPFSDERPIVRGMLIYRNGDSQRCLQYVNLELIRREGEEKIVEVLDTSMGLCQVEDDFEPDRSVVVRIGKTYSLTPR